MTLAKLSSAPNLVPYCRRYHVRHVHVLHDRSSRQLTTLAMRLHLLTLPFVFLLGLTTSTSASKQEESAQEGAEKQDIVIHYLEGLPLCHVCRHVRLPEAFLAKVIACQAKCFIFKAYEPYWPGHGQLEARSLVLQYHRGLLGISPTSTWFITCVQPASITPVPSVEIPLHSVGTGIGKVYCRLHSR